MVHVLAGLAFALTATWLQYRLENIVVHPWGFALQVWTWALPTIVVLCLVQIGDRRRQQAWVAGYLAVVGLFAVRMTFSETPPLSVDAIALLPSPVALLAAIVNGGRPPHTSMVTLPAWGQVLLIFWMHVYVLLPALLFLSRRIRAVGPLVVVVFIVLAAGGVFSTVAFSTWAGMQVQTRLSMAGVSMAAMPTLVVLIGGVAAAPLALLAGLGLSAAHRGKWINDQSVVLDAVWLFATVILVAELVHHAGAAGLMGFASFAVYKAVAVAGLYPSARDARRRRPVKLLLLRVFGHRRRSERLLDVLAARWRYAGPIQMIGAPDVAARTADPDEIMSLLGGRLRRRFLIEPADLPRRLSEIDTAPDPDGRFRINDVYCGDDAWRPAVQALMQDSDACVMDLRGFREGNSGCIFELQALLELVPAEAVILLVDRSSDVPLLARTLHECRARVTEASVNGQAPAPFVVIDASDSDLRSVEEVMLAADVSLRSPRRAMARPPEPARESVDISV